MPPTAVFDIGIQTTTALDRFRARHCPPRAGPRNRRANGNGSLMRVLPLALWHRGSDAELAADAMVQSLPTHGHLRSQACCVLYCLSPEAIRDGMPPGSGVAGRAAAFDGSTRWGSPEHDELEAHVFPDGAAYGSAVVATSWSRCGPPSRCCWPTTRWTTSGSSRRRSRWAMTPTRRRASPVGSRGSWWARAAYRCGGVTALRGHDLVEPLLDALVSWRGSGDCRRSHVGWPGVRRHRPGPHRRARAAAGIGPRAPSGSPSTSSRPMPPMCAARPGAGRGQGQDPVLRTVRQCRRGARCRICADPRRDQRRSASSRSPRTSPPSSAPASSAGSITCSAARSARWTAIGPEDLRIRELMQRLADGGGHRGHHRHRPQHRRRGHRHLSHPHAGAAGVCV
jgi:hypothetical protein